MYTSMMQKLLFQDSDDDAYLPHYPNMVLPLLGADTDLPALAAILAKERATPANTKGVVASIILWIISNRPQELGDFCKAYGTPAKVYEAISERYLPKNVSQHFKVHELVSESINPQWKLCKDPRMGSFGIDKDLLAKAPLSEPRYTTVGSWIVGWAYSYLTEEDAVEAVKEYFFGRHFDIMFIHTTQAYKDWIEQCKKDGKTELQVKKGLTLLELEILLPKERDSRYICFSATNKANELEVTLHKVDHVGDVGKKIMSLCTFTVGKIVDPHTYKQIISEASKLPISENTNTQEVKE